ncbi:MAG: choice-of-anchor L domain-containing protein [Thermaurantimonas sp.]|uniref:choice-of-anchor L domain-containing protein n=1 Tax=Thermaurantimonas sp. TaxID=2681568 RepID=UPI00391C4A63
MVRKILFSVFLWTSGIYIQAQLIVNNTGQYQNGMWLVKNIFVQDSLIVFWFGPQPQWPNTNQIGAFNGVNTNIGIDTGIIMVTAPATDALVGGNAVGPGGPMTDAQLQALQQQMGITGGLFSIARIEFDFISYADSLEFEYVFASKEYQSYTCTAFNDVFGFFLTGPGINNAPSNQITTQNIALIPGTNIPVAINTLNGGAPTGGGNAAICLAANPNFVAHSIYFNNAPLGTSYNGATKPLKAVAKVQCGNYYRIKLAIANVSDNALNSAVFLRANSFKIPKLEMYHTGNSPGYLNKGDTISESCGSFPIVFKRTFNTQIPLTIKFNTGGTAIAGTDYIALPDSFVIAPGKVYDTLWVTPINNKISQQPRLLSFNTYYTWSPCYQYPLDTVRIWIRDPKPMNGGILNKSGYDTVYCPGDSIKLEVLMTGGEGKAFGWWADGDTNKVRWFSVLSDTTVFFYITDSCYSDTIVLSKALYANTSKDITIETLDYGICQGEKIQIEATFTGDKPPFTFGWQGGFPQDTRMTVQPMDTTFYYFIVTDKCGNVKVDSSVVYVYPEPEAAFRAEQISFVELAVQMFNNSKKANAYFWDFGDGKTSILQNPKHIYSTPGSYIVTLVASNEFGCQDTIRRNINVRRDFLIYIPNSFTPNGDGKNDVFQVTAEGIEGYQIQIFNRWGQMVFESNDVTNSWDGKYLNQDAPQGLYLYKILVTLKNDVKEERSGTIHLIR